MNFERFGFRPLELLTETLNAFLLNIKEEEDFLYFLFIKQTGECFSVKKKFNPYILLELRDGVATIDEKLIRQKLPAVTRISVVKKTCLNSVNHLSGEMKSFVKLEFDTGEALIETRRNLQRELRNNSMVRVNYGNTNSSSLTDSISSMISDLKEYDISLITRVMIDHDYRIGLWYALSPEDKDILIERNYDLIIPPDFPVCAFDIETSKQPLKFPSMETDEIMMISYMVSDSEGYLIINRNIVSKDLQSFEYSPKEEYQGNFVVYNESSEEALLQRFFTHMKQLKPLLYVTYNGDYFDFPYVEYRAKVYGLDMKEEIGVFLNNDYYECLYGSHMDCLKWVKRDSYLPVGSQGLKSVTKYKLGYDPKELDPELMTPYAYEKPEILADYSVSDAVATYYLYKKYIFTFIFSLCNIIPLLPDDVLRKGSGTLCECLLMVEAYKANVIMPNKHQEQKGVFYEGHLLLQETYVGGHVEALQSGIYRSDIPIEFKMNPGKLQELSASVEDVLEFSLKTEYKTKKEDVENFDEICAQIKEELLDLQMNPNDHRKPLIYHLDVGAMYPNIILTNRLQPPAIVTEDDCVRCEYFDEQEQCQRKMEWVWRGEYFPALKSEYNMIRNQLEQETFENGKKFNELSEAVQLQKITKRLTEYCKKVYHKTKQTQQTKKKSIVCQRENSFYVDTVRNFRDRRYEYKAKLKEWKNNAEADAQVKEKMVVLMDSLQLAHKCILNSFYGYVMRKGSRWYSMEMAGIVCYTGSKIIRMARELVDDIGKPLELDTDGIWCMLPKGFPENYAMKLKSGKVISISYPCSLLNHMVHSNFTNNQYHELVDPENNTFEVRSENSIFFEVDGPYHGMMLPASTEENRLLKKRYAVFNEDGSLSELKGFEVKRRGELKMVKVFQEQVFDVITQGTNLKECYSHLAEVCDRWLDMLFTRGEGITVDELVEYISENRSMSKALEEYGKQKSTSITTAKRLAEFLGDQMVKEKGLACKFIIASKPQGAPVAERAIPIAIFQAEEQVCLYYLRRWMKDSLLTTTDIRDLLDWDYYLERVGSVIQKLVTIPAAMQGVTGLVTRVKPPEWVTRGVSSKQQRKIDEFFKVKEIEDKDSDSDESELEAEKPKVVEIDIEDIGSKKLKLEPPPVEKKQRLLKKLSKSHVDCQNDKNPFDDYQEWLQVQKTKWKTQRNARRDYADRTSNSLFKRQNPINSSASYFPVHINRTDSPGVYRLFLVNTSSGGNEVVNVRIKVQRVFYVDCVEKDDSRPLCLSKTIPSDHSVSYLYEFKIDEEEYERKKDTYLKFMWHNQTLRVYEDLIPLDWRFLTSMRSNLLKLNLSYHNKGNCLHSETDLKFVTITNAMKFDPISCLQTAKVAYLYHVEFNAKKSFYTLIFGESIHVFVFDANNVQKVTTVNTSSVKKVYKERLSRLEQMNDKKMFNYLPEMNAEFTLSTVDDPTPGIVKLITKFKDSSPNFMLVFHSNRPLNSLQTRVVYEFPVFEMHVQKQDYQQIQMDWHRVLLNRSVQSYLHLNDYFLDRAVLNDYAGGCVLSQLIKTSDPLMFMYDLLLSRQAEDHHLLSWYKLSQSKDGGLTTESISGLETHEKFKILNPGYYEKYTFEFDLTDLCMAAIVQSTLLQEMEGVQDESATMKNLDSYFNTAGAAQGIKSNSAFKSLKMLVRKFAKDNFIGGNVVARMMLNNLYRFISSKSMSNIYDPQLHAFVDSLMKKMLLQLMAEIQRLFSGKCSFVYASFDKIIISFSNIKSYKAFEKYTEYVLDRLKKNDLFGMLGIKKSDKLYLNYLFLNEENFAGVLSNNEQDDDKENQISLDTAAKWRLSAMFPKKVAFLFGEIIKEFLLKLVTDCSKISLKEFTMKLLGFVKVIHQKQQQDDEEYSLSHTSHILRLKQAQSSEFKAENYNAALEFVVAATHLFSLNASLSDDVRISRKNCLQLLGTMEFSKEADFDASSSETIILENVLCSYCQCVADVDLLAGYYDNTLSPFACKACKYEYDLEEFEMALIEKVESMVLSYHCQDLVCSKCKAIMRENMRLYCKLCAEPYILITDSYSKENKTWVSGYTSAKEIQKLIQTLKILATDYKMELLRSTLVYYEAN
ncbi:hypothetical protein MP638_000173 [Amoeboaphelidium occidentale]|nr:hypothetical protein MP638_000173 [Amoeboaphelidium occidentale]